MLEHYRINVLKWVHVNKTNGSRACIISHYSFFYLLFIISAKKCDGFLNVIENTNL